MTANDRTTAYWIAYNPHWRRWFLYAEHRPGYTVSAGVYPLRLIPPTK